MIVRSKTKVRLLILLAGVALLIGGATGVYFIRKSRIHNYYVGQRAIGMAEYKKGNYPTALVKLGQYIRREEFAGDEEAIYAFADARRHVEIPGNKHLAQAMTAFQRVLALNADRTDVKRELLDLYTQLGYNIEAEDLATKLLLVDKNDLQALRARARACYAQQKIDVASTDCKTINDLVPLDLEIRALSLEILREQSRKSEILPIATEILAKNPDDPKAELLLSIACTMLDEITEAQRTGLRDLASSKYPKELAEFRTSRNPKDPPSLESLGAFDYGAFFALQASKRDLGDLVLVRYLVAQLDHTRQVNESLEVLQKVDAKQSGPWVRQFLIRRLWESGRFADVMKHMEKMEIAGSTPGEIELLAIRAISQARTDRKEDAAKTVATLAGLKEDRIAQAWATTIQELILKDDGKPRDVIDATRSALELQRNNPYLRFFLGLGYLQLGERDAAMEAFSQVATARPLWQQPLMHLSRLMLEAGQKRAALEYAYEAYRINSTIASASNWLIMLAANTELSAISVDSDLYKNVKILQTEHPGEEATLPLYVQLLAMTRQNDAAKKIVNDALTSQTPPAAGTFLRLAAVSREFELGLEDACYQAAEKSAGRLTPPIALARALAMRQTDGSAAEKYLHESMQKAGATDVSWRLAWATFLEDSNDKRAAPAWIALADDPALKTNINVQRDALAAPSVQQDTAFLTRTIDRIRAIAGEPSIGWKLAQARVAVRTATKENSAEVIKSLKEIVAAAPNNIDARLMLASAYEKAGQIPAALEQLTAVRKHQPNANALNLDLARLYMAQLDFQRAREILANTSSSQLNPAQRRTAARLLGQQGDVFNAIKFLEAGLADAPSLDRLYLAELYRRVKQDDKAEAIYQSLLQNPDRIEVVMAAADYYASRGEKGKQLAMQILTNLDKLQLKPADKDYALAEFSSRYGDSNAAIARLQAVVQADPSQPEGWQALVRECIRARRADEAVKAAQQAIRVLPRDAAQPYHNVVNSGPTLAELAPQKTLHPLMMGLLEPAPNGEAAAQALPIIAEGIRTHAASHVMTARLRPIADRAPELAALQMLLVQNYLLSRDPAKPREAAQLAAQAAEIALRSLKFAPNSPEIARNAAIAVAATEDYAKAITLAQQWRGLTPENPLPADVFLAQCHMRLDDYPAVLRDLQPHAQAAKANPADPNLAIVNTYRAQAMLMRGDEAAAAELLSPALATVPQVRGVWRDLTQFLPTPLAQKWLERLAAATPADAVNEQLDLAIAWRGLYAGRGRLANGELRFAGSRDPKHKEAADTILDRLATAAPDHPLVVQARAIIAETENRLGAAEQGYRRALELKSDLPISLNNLANILIGRGDLKEALSLAQRAVTASPYDASIRDTLADVQLRMKDYAGAGKNFQVILELDPKSIKWRIKLAQVYAQAGQNQELSAILDEIEKMMSDDNTTADQRDIVRQLRSKVPKTALR